MADPQSLPRNKRAAHYKEQAAKLRQMAEAEPVGGILGDSLRSLAGEYDKLAGSLEVLR
jgi:hypothetical protein